MDAAWIDAAITAARPQAVGALLRYFRDLDTAEEAFQDACLRDGYDGLFSFLCWTYKPYGTAFGGREISPREYWRHMALSRIFLDNVKHIRTSVLTQNEEAFRALDYGADDFDLPIEDEVTQKAGARIELDLEGLLAIPRRLGYEVEYRRAERPAALTS